MTSSAGPQFENQAQRQSDNYEDSDAPDFLLASGDEWPVAWKRFFKRPDTDSGRITRFPAHRPEPGSAAANRVMSIDHPPPLLVLIVEDLEDAAQSTAELLSLCGHDVRVANCGADALRAIDEEMPDVVLLDIGLPGVSGWEVSRQIRGTARRKQPLIVAVTGHSTQDDRLRSADSGIDLHLVKPADPATLTGILARVREHLATRC